MILLARSFTWAAGSDGVSRVRVPLSPPWPAMALLGSAEMAGQRPRLHSNTRLGWPWTPTGVSTLQTPTILGFAAWGRMALSPPWPGVVPMGVGMVGRPPRQYSTRRLGWPWAPTAAS